MAARNRATVVYLPSPAWWYQDNITQRIDPELVHSVIQCLLQDKPILDHDFIDTVRLRFALTECLAYQLVFATLIHLERVINVAFHGVVAESPTREVTSASINLWAQETLEYLRTDYNHVEGIYVNPKTPAPVLVEFARRQLLQMLAKCPDGARLREPPRQYWDIFERDDESFLSGSRRRTDRGQKTAIIAHTAAGHYLGHVYVWTDDDYKSTLNMIGIRKSIKDFILSGCQREEKAQADKLVPILLHGVKHYAIRRQLQQVRVLGPIGRMPALLSRCGFKPAAALRMAVFRDYHAQVQDISCLAEIDDGYMAPNDTGCLIQGEIVM